MAGSGSYDGYFTGDGEQQPTNWKLGSLIARGRFTTISHVINGPAEAAVCAVKQSVISDDHDTETLKNIDDEVRLLKKVKHHRINDYYGFSRTPRVFSLFIAYMKMGSLARYLKSQPNERLSEERTACFTYQILEGLAYLHKEKIIHRDIKGSNILMQDENNIKISDFGVAKILTTLSRANTKNKGTVNWMAPELFQSDSKYLYEVDIWSLGCTSYQMITGKIPFNELKEYELLIKAHTNKLELPIPEECSAELKDFLKLACAKFGKDRPTAHKLMQHVFLKDSMEETSVMKVDLPIQASQDNVDLDLVDRPSFSSGEMSATGYMSQASGVDSSISSVQMDGIREDNIASAQYSNSHNDELDSVQISKINDMKAKLRANYAQLVRELNPKDVLPQLFQKDVISFDEMEELGPKARRDSAIQLLGILMRKKESDCAKFVEILLQVGYTDIYDSIVNTDQKPQLETLPAPWFDELPDSTKNKIISEIDASRLATILGNNWESVLYNLGFRKAQIDQEFQSNGSNTQRTISNTLIKWKQRSGRNATFNNLIKTFRESEKNNNAYIDWERLEPFLTQF